MQVSVRCIWKERRPFTVLMAFVFFVEFLLSSSYRVMMF